MRKTLEERLAEQDTWTFRECVGLAAEYGTKTRQVIVTLMVLGKNYVDDEAGTSAPGEQPPSG